MHVCISLRKGGGPGPFHRRHEAAHDRRDEGSLIRLVHEPFRDDASTTPGTSPTGRLGVARRRLGLPRSKGHEIPDGHTEDDGEDVEGDIFGSVAAHAEMERPDPSSGREARSLPREARRARVFATASSERLAWSDLSARRGRESRGDGGEPRPANAAHDPGKFPRHKDKKPDGGSKRREEESRPGAQRRTRWRSGLIILRIRLRKPRGTQAASPLLRRHGHARDFDRLPKS
jgi:hypothetical protein